MLKDRINEAFELDNKFRIEPLVDKLKGKTEQEAWKLIYMWVKQGHIGFSEFIQLCKRLSSNQGVQI